jgi:phage protein D
MAAAEETFQPIYEGRDFYVPAFDIKIQGRDIPKETARDVVEVRYSDSLDKVDTMELTINNWDADKYDFKYTGSKKGGLDERSKLFMPEQVIELFMGYFKPLGQGSTTEHPNSLSMMLAGKISKLAPTFPSSGAPTLKVSGQSVLSRLSTKQETYHYTPKTFGGEEMTASMIAYKVGERGNLKIGNMKVVVRIDEEAYASEPQLKYVLQDNQYDIVFLLQLAHRCGYNVVLKKEGTEGQEKYYIQFGPTTNEPHISYTLEWGRSLIQFEPTLSTQDQVKEVVVRGWNAQTKQPIKITRDRSQIPGSPYKTKKDLDKLEEGFKEKKEIIIDQPFDNEKQAIEYAMGQFKKMNGRMVTAHGSTLGTPDLRAGSRVEILGLGDYFDGTYTVKSTSHVISGSGYITEFDVRMEDKR